MGLTGTTGHLGKPNTRNKYSEKTWIDDAPCSTADQGDPQDSSDDGLQLDSFCGHAAGRLYYAHPGKCGCAVLSFSPSHRLRSDLQVN